MLLLEVKDLSCSREHGRNVLLRKTRKQLLAGITFSLDKGQTFGVVGGSGVGKTTLAKCLAGLVQPDSGSITLDGVNIFPEIANRENNPLAIQIVFQAGGEAFNPKMTIGNSVAEALTARQPGLSFPDLEKESEGLLSSVQLSPELLQRYPHQLSGGQRQRVAIARMLAVRPMVLILDEPTSALDVLTQRELLYLLRSLQQQHGFSILLISHDIPTAFKFCHRIAIVHEGTIIEQGPPDTILAKPQHPYTKQLLAECQMLTA